MHTLAALIVLTGLLAVASPLQANDSEPLNRIIVMGQVHGSSDWVAGRRIQRGQGVLGRFERLYFKATTSGNRTTTTRIMNRSGKKIVVHVFNGSDKVRAVPRYLRKLNNNRSTTIPCDAWSYLIKEDRRVIDKKMSTRNNVRAAEIEIGRGGRVTVAKKATDTSFTFTNGTHMNLRISIFNEKDIIRAVPKKIIKVEAGKTASWANADASFRYRVFEDKKALDRRLTDGVVRGKLSMTFRTYPFSGFESMYSAMGRSAPQFKGMPVPVRTAQFVNHDGAAHVMDLVSSARTTDDKLALISWHARAAGPLRLAGPVKTSWDSTYLGLAPTPWELTRVAGTPSLVIAELADFGIVGGGASYQDIAFVRTTNGDLAWGVVTHYPKKLKERRWVDNEPNWSKIDNVKLAGDPVVAMRRQGDVVAIAYRTADNRARVGFWSEDNDLKFADGHTLPGEIVGQPSIAWDGRDLYITARNDKAHVLWAHKKNGKDWSDWTVIAGGVNGDPSMVKILAGQWSWVIAARVKGGYYRSIYFDRKEKRWRGWYTMTDRRFATPPVLLYTNETF